MRRLAAIIIFSGVIAACVAERERPAGEPGSIEISAGISHEVYDALLKKHVDAKGLVDYAGWKSSGEDVAALGEYLKQFESKPRQAATGDEKAAAIINLYNALTIRWVLQNHPIRSIQSLSNSFGERRHRVSGQNISLDDIEHRTLIPQIGYRAHGVLVCAARSCPPLQRSAFTGPRLDAQVEAAYREWLAREDLNEFIPERSTAEVSSIFKWFSEDFEKAGGLKKILARFGPEETQEFLRKGDYEIRYKTYDWSLNAQSSKGQSYSRIRMILDRVVDFLTFWN